MRLAALLTSMSVSRSTYLGGSVSARIRDKAGIAAPTRSVDGDSVVTRAIKDSSEEADSDNPLIGFAASGGTVVSSGSRATSRSAGDDDDCFGSTRTRAAGVKAASGD